jgi:hypothetical protein
VPARRAQDLREDVQVGTDAGPHRHAVDFVALRPEEDFDLPSTSTQRDNV